MAQINTLSIFYESETRKQLCINHMSISCCLKLHFEKHSQRFELSNCVRLLFKASFEKYSQLLKPSKS